jgi:Domain of unknown function (DUF3854)
VTNAHFELLIGRAYDGALAPEHLEDLRKSGLTDETIAAQFIRSIPPGLISRLLGFDLPAIRSALLFPFRAPTGGFADLVRMKIFPPLRDAEGHTVKYLQPKGSAPRLYFVARCLRQVLEGEAPLWLVEGEKKALAVAQLGLPAIGFAGVEGWHRRGELRLLPDFDAIRLRDRIVEVLPDADAETNPHVRRAVRTLGDALAVRGARPRLVHLPSELSR